MIVGANVELQLNVEIAETSFKRLKGLMFRSSLEENEGMLFIFDKPCTPSIWNLFTFASLDTIFIREDGKISEIHSLPSAVLPTKTIKSAERVKYVLEVAEGFSIKNKISAGNKVAL